MRQFIEEKINEIFDDFRDELLEKRYYCELKELRFDGGNIPDYYNPIIQKYYLLRYMTAYFVEYYLIYKKLFELDFLDNNLNIFSIGSGCGIDFWGAKFARDLHSPETSICYTGIDSVDWDYKDNLGIEEHYFWHCNINSLDELDDDSYNVIIFPKSIGEFDLNTFYNLREVIKNSNFSENKLVVLSSLRKTRNDFDIERIASIINHQYI